MITISVIKLSNDDTLFHGCSMMHLVLVLVCGYAYGMNYDLIESMDKKLAKVYTAYYEKKKNYHAFYSNNKKAVHAICDPVSNALTHTIAQVTDIFIDEKATTDQIHWYVTPTDVLWAEDLVTVNMPRTVRTARNVLKGVTKAKKQMSKRKKKSERKGSGVQSFSKKKASKRPFNLDNVYPTLKKRKIN